MLFFSAGLKHFNFFFFNNLGISDGHVWEYSTSSVISSTPQTLHPNLHLTSHFHSVFFP